jgi:3'(2'), 5'-bisphosphate nucleotidase
MSNFSVEQLEKIHWLLFTAGEQAVQMAKEPFEVFEKGAEDYVTNIDRLLDEKLTAGFAALFPDDGIISEENVISRQAFHQHYSRLWLIDPLDGTDDFIQRKLHYAVMVGLLQEGKPIAGWVYAPALGQMYYGGVDWGLFQVHQQTSDALPYPTLESSTPLPVVEPPVLSDQFCPIIIGDKDRRRYGTAIAQLIPGVQFKAIGSFGLKVMQVICGQAGIYVYFNQRVKLWDTVGPIALAKAAGLVCCDLEGHPLHFTSSEIDSETLAHQQSIVVGWEAYVTALLPRLQQAVHTVQSSPKVKNPEV